MTINYEKLTGCCNRCEKVGFKLVEGGYCHCDLDDNGICLDCYNILNQNKLAKKFRTEWLDYPRPSEIDIYE